MNCHWDRTKTAPVTKALIPLSIKAVVTLSGISLGVVLLFLAPSTFAQTQPDVQPAAGAITRPTLRVGSQGATVRELQALLTLLGFYQGSVDGNFQDSTTTAVITFQQAAGLTADGIVGANTWSRLLPSVTPVTTTAAAGESATQSAAPAPRPATAPASASSTSETATLPMLRLGMRGSAVARLQQRLRAIGVFEGEVDGIFGTATQNAVKAAQRRFNLNPDGIVGNATWTALLR